MLTLRKLFDARNKAFFDLEIYEVEEIPAPKSIWQRICEGTRNFGVWFGDNWGGFVYYCISKPSIDCCSLLCL
jgi:hypothetical protein